MTKGIYSSMMIVLVELWGIAHVGQSVAPAASEYTVPLPPNPLLGREQDLTAVVALVQRPDVRLVTITGPGGTGKTRLSLEIASHLAPRYRNGAAYVALADLRDPQLVLSVVAQALGVREVGSEPLVKTLQQALHDQELVLVLDNLEQVIDAAPVVADVLAACPGLTILATSRIPLHIRSEHVYPLAPLAIPSQQTLLPEQLAQVAAVGLFVERAKAAQPSFELTEANAEAVAAICRRLDGLPLAIELAAGWVRMLPPAALLSRLERQSSLLTGGARDLPTRHQTLRDTIAWSYDLLDESEQQLFRRLGIFAGGVSFEAAELVVGADVDVLTGLARLVDHALVRADEDSDGMPQFGMLSTIREYAREQLEAAGEAVAVAERHLAHFLALAEEAEEQLWARGQEVWAPRLEAEHDNLRAALEWALEHDTDAGLRLAGALGRFWWGRGYFREGRRWLEAALERSGAGSVAVRAKVLLRLSELVREQGEKDLAHGLAAESLLLFQELGERSRTAEALRFLGVIASDRGNVAQAREYWEQARELYREVKATDAFGPRDTYSMAATVNNLGLLALMDREYGRAEEFLEEALSLARKHGNPEPMARVLDSLGWAAFGQEDHLRARARFQESRQLHQKHGLSPLTLALAQLGLGWVSLDERDDAQAESHFVDAINLLEEHGLSRIVPEALDSLAMVGVVRRVPHWAARLFGAAEASRETLTAEPLMEPRRMRLLEEYRQQARAQRDAAAWEQSWAQGRQLTMEEAIAEAKAGVPATRPEETATPPVTAPMQPSPSPAPANDVLDSTRSAVDPTPLTRQPPDTGYVFLSYASVNRDQVLAIAAQLEAAGIRVWLDQKDIAAGTSWGAAIAHAIRDCAALVIACTEASLASRNVRQEIQLAWRYERPYLPLLLDLVPVPDELAYFLEGCQWVEVLDRSPGVWLPRVLHALDQLGLTPTRSDDSTA